DQLGCADPVDVRGAFFFPGSRDANVFATVQAVPALAKATFPLAPSTPKSTVPTMPCAAAVAPAAALTRASATAAALAGTAGACPTKTSGVTVAVDFTAFGGKVQVRCAPGA